MIIEFTTGNFLSFKDKMTLSLVPAGITEYKLATFKVANQKLLKSAILYGANSSGKSNFLNAMLVMKRLVMTSMEKSSVSKNTIKPFLLNPNTEKQPSFFEVVFLVDKKRYRYGFEMDYEKVHSEWLFILKGKKEKPMFIREQDGIAVEKLFEEGKNLEARTRDNALFLSVNDQFDGDISKQLMYWFSTWRIVSGLSHEDYRGVTYKFLEDSKCKSKLLDFYKDLDLGFDALKLKTEKFNPDMLSSDIPDEILNDMISELEGKTMARVNTVHKTYDSKGNPVGVKNFDLRKQESSGTNKIVDLSGSIFDTLINGGILVIDELDAKLHPLMTTAITNLFNSDEHNQKNAQLIFATHDTNLLTYGHFRRDQIYFVEKNNYESSDLYSLIEYSENGKTIRKDRSFERDYIQGRYGAIPFIGSFDELIAGAIDGKEN